MMQQVSLKQVEQQYGGQWLAFLVSEETSTGEVLGQLIAHNPDRRELHRELREKNVERAYVTFAGPVVKLGYIEGLLGLSFLRYFRTLIDYTTGVLEITAGH